MCQYKQATKQQVREYMKRRLAAHTPPPSLDQIRRELGLRLIDACRAGK